MGQQWVTWPGLAAREAGNLKVLPSSLYIRGKLREQWVGLEPISSGSSIPASQAAPGVATSFFPGTPGPARIHPATSCPLTPACSGCLFGLARPAVLPSSTSHNPSYKATSSWKPSLTSPHPTPALPARWSTPLAACTSLTHSPVLGSPLPTLCASCWHSPQANQGQGWHPAQMGISEPRAAMGAEPDGEIPIPMFQEVGT